jgi:hypothetical protein
MSLYLTFSNFASYLEVRRRITLLRDPALQVREASFCYKIRFYLWRIMRIRGLRSLSTNQIQAGSLCYLG